MIRVVQGTQAELSQVSTQGAEQAQEGVPGTELSEPMHTARAAQGAEHTVRKLDRAGQALRTSSSVRSEEAYRDWTEIPPTQRPLAIARGRASDLFFALLREARMRGEDALTTVAIADRVGVVEKTVRGWCDGSKPLPLGLPFVLPAQLAIDLLTRMLSAVRGGDPVRIASSQLRECMAVLEEAARSGHIPDKEKLQVMKTMLFTRAMADEIADVLSAEAP